MVITLCGKVTQVGEKFLRCYVARTHQCQSEATHGRMWAVKVTSFETDVSVSQHVGALMSLKGLHLLQSCFIKLKCVKLSGENAGFNQLNTPRLTRLHCGC